MTTSSHKGGMNALSDEQSAHLQASNLLKKTTLVNKRKATVLTLTFTNFQLFFYIVNCVVVNILVHISINTSLIILYRINFGTKSNNPEG